MLSCRMLFGAVARIVPSLLVALYLCEVLHYQFQIGCDTALLVSFDSRRKNVRDGGLGMLVVSDVHVLGEKKRNALDRWWTDRQLWRTVGTATRKLSPNIVMSLGDNLDEGFIHTPNIQQWEAYADRFSTSLHLRRSSDLKNIVSVVGNHDAEAGSKQTGEMLERFEKTFGKTNRLIKLDGGIEIVVLNAMAFDFCADFGDGLGHLKETKVCSDITKFLESLEDRKRDSVRIFATHMPLNRANDLGCGAVRLREKGHVTYVAPNAWLQVGSDVVSAPSSVYLLKRILPDVVLSGHLHAQCIQEHKLMGTRIMEVTLPTFSWRMRPDPGFGMVRVEKDYLEVDICKVPNEHTTIKVYIVVGVLVAITVLVTFTKQPHNQKLRQH
mmetsp:Transcript_1886/g.3263  ORF Transcript_1886/g.3263 Transcript_1886/m.3263 type:complete len:383 (+) Transcript_1886:169-1317(+)|eukprot:CAMPEP_0203770870 /NCGR_PEP_ID=MMETSP0099_2-20121227/3085_1 /ASSEMBLY_ACC=CAM_ASM_000209 /TAXON_ID=96639 /ORGANISM=" , Strain NY0313808BC1" /LENGTH=382 /DNA_ID=CAMNT_0050668123 /DNA_START=200 /DNA_END=1348 /DNA_ORIENTATION=+